MTLAWAVSFGNKGLSMAIYPNEDYLLAGAW